jgi:poly-gamma-glutamate synthesis protein (capsule biosynthesis protein)
MRIMFVGDINLGEYYTAFGHGPRTYSKNNDIFDSVREVLSKADLVAGNLEAPLTNHAYRPTKVESSVLRGDPAHAEILSSANFKILQLANNHTVQHGPEGFQETVETLKSVNIEPVGIAGQELLTFDIDSQTVGFLAASDVPDNTNADQRSYQRLDADFLKKISASVNLVDHLFVMLHWGLESSTKPMKYQKLLISELCDKGVRGVIGAHPHLFYEIWHEGNTIAAPSLGNFVFDLFWDPRLLKSGVLDIELTKKGITACRAWPATISEHGGRPILTGSAQNVGDFLKLYELGSDMSGEQSKKLIKLIKDLSKGNQCLKSQFILKKLSGKI